MRIKHTLLLLLLGASVLTQAQQSSNYTSIDRIYDEAVELFEKEKYAAAQEMFSQYIEAVPDTRDELHVNSEYYFGICALYLFHKDAEYVLEKFVADHPDSRWVEQVYLELATYNYQRKRYKKALEWFEYVDPLDLNEQNRTAFYYRRGHSRFEEEAFTEAKSDFYEVKDKPGDYQLPALYYFSHLSYEEGNLQTALNGFQQLQADPNFAPIAPYYITQIYYRQGRCDEVLSYARPLLDGGEINATKRIPEISRVIGNCLYRDEDYAGALPYLQKYHDETDKKDISALDHYQFGFTKYRTGDYNGALESFSNCSQEENETGQSALYHMADCYLKLDQKQYARNAFKEASELDYNMAVKEDALFNYAKLAYELSFNPFNEAIIAFEKYLEDYPDSPRRDEAYSFLLNVYLKTRNYGEALRSLDKIQNKDGQVQQAYQLVAFNYAVELFQAGKLQEAYSYFEKVKTYPVNPTLNAEALYWKAEIAYREDKFAQAVSLYNQFIVEPGAVNSGFYEEANYGAGYALFKQKKYVTAITSFRKYTDAASQTDPRKKSDALMRLGDCYYVNKEYNKAIEYYDRAIKMDQPLQDYAMYQKALCYGLKGDPAQEIKVLKDLLDTQPDSRYYVDAKFQLARTYMQDDRRAEARPLYQSIVNDHSSSAYVSRSLLDLCLIHTKNDDREAAINTFERIRQNYPNEKVLKDALLIVRNILLEEKGPDYLSELSEQNSILDISRKELDDELFFSAADLYFREECDKAIDALSNYLNKFTPALHAVEAHYYIAECHFAKGETAKALESYNFVITQPVAEVTEDALVAAATIRFNQKEYDKALTHYIELEGLALKKNNVLEAEIGQMRCYAKMDLMDKALIYADRVLGNDATPEPIRNEALLMRGKIRMSKGNLDEAYYDFAELAAKTGVRAAEAKYHMALIAYQKEAWKPAEKETFELIQKFSGFPEYKYKGFLLLADIYVQMEDYFQARTTLNTILDNVSEPWVIDEARERMDALDALENKALNPGIKSKSIEIDLSEGEGDEEELIEETPENE